MTAIEFENISKQYRLGLVSTRTISHDLNRWWQMNILRREDPYLKIGDVNDRASKGESEYVWALKDISFKVEQGDVLGIIGKNGAGKSTLLKILSKVTSPTTGTIKARGRIASLLEVGTGFHPEMTGRENIYMNGAIMGMTKSEITRKLDEIVDFAGVERYIDTPVKRYSSGMTVRLGFAIAAHLEPEILVVDEVLAVGDAEFQKKAIGKMQDVSRGEGRTVLFVSHNMAAIKNLCVSGLVLNNGSISYLGSADEAINIYLSSNLSNNRKKIDRELRVIKARSKRYTRDVYFKEIFLENDKEDYYTNDEIIFICKLVANRDTEDIRINATIYDSNETAVGGWFGNDFFNIKQDAQKTIKVCLRNHNLTLGTYFVSFSVGKGDFIKGKIEFDVILKVEQFNIVGYDSIQNIGYTTWYKDWGNVIFEAKCEEIENE